VYWAAGVDPNETARTLVKFSPVIVTSVPPAGGPALGRTLSTNGQFRKTQACPF